jgi:hypothetical protein
MVASENGVSARPGVTGGETWVKFLSASSLGLRLGGGGFATVTGVVVELGLRFALSRGEGMG